MHYWMLLPVAIIAFVFPFGLYHALKGEMQRKTDRYEKIIKGQNKEECIAEARELLASMQPQQQGLTLRKSVKPVSYNSDECVKMIHYHFIPQKQKNLSILSKTMPLMLISFPLLVVPLLLFTAPLGFAVIFACIIVLFIVEFWLVFKRTFLPFLQEEIEYLKQADEHLSHILGVSE